jgi:hypothetical protein
VDDADPVVSPCERELWLPTFLLNKVLTSGYNVLVEIVV